MTSRYEVLGERLDQLLEAVLLHGPMTLYEAHKALRAKHLSTIKSDRSRISQTSTDRHLKILEEEQVLFVYGTEPHQSGHTKKFYGLTFYGFLRSFQIPTGVARRNFKRVMDIWLPEKKFRFFLPKNEVIDALDHKEVVVHLARLCQVVADSLPEAEDIADYLEEVGIAHAGSVELIINLATRFGEAKHSAEFVETSKVLCKYIPTFKKRIQGFIQTHRTTLDRLERALELGTDREDKR